MTTQAHRIAFLTAFTIWSLALLIVPQAIKAQDKRSDDYERQIRTQNDRRRDDRTEAERRAAEEGARRAIALRQDDAAQDEEEIAADEIDAVATGLNPVPEKVVPVWAIHNVTFSPDGSKLVAGLGTGDIHVWSLSDQSLSIHPEIHLEWTFATVFDAEGRTIFSAGGDNQIHRWTGLNFDEKAQSYVGHSGDIHALAVTDDSRRLVSAGDDMTPIIWDVDTGEELFRLETHPRQIPGLALSPDGSKVATACRDGKIRTFSMTTGELLLTHQGHESDALTVRFTEDGSRIVSGGYDGVVTIYDVDMGHQVLKTNATEGAIVCVDVSHDGQIIIVATDEEIIRCTIEGDDVVKDVFRAELGANEQFSFVRFSPDENVIAASTTGQKIILLNEDLTETLGTLRDPDFAARRKARDQ